MTIDFYVSVIFSIAINQPLGNASYQLINQNLSWYQDNESKPYYIGGEAQVKQKFPWFYGNFLALILNFSGHLENKQIQNDNTF